MTDNVDLSSLDATDMEVLPEGNALGCFSTTTSTSTASCPASTAGCASTWACLG
ncbi:thiocillin family RiPP [Actinomyces qiguomingii]|uniref:thiocillin family RiPP n=1 Tax=Actinomyces qiguomingii TaxID=2057800 RepID=UPI000CA08637|nr:thiocillin family RiPP [Actinomyces qiguomingii]